MHVHANNIIHPNNITLILNMVHDNAYPKVRFLTIWHTL